MHPAGLRCSSLTYARYARSSRLAGRAPRRHNAHLNRWRRGAGPRKMGATSWKRGAHDCSSMAFDRRRGAAAGRRHPRAPARPADRVTRSFKTMVAVSRRRRLVAVLRARPDQQVECRATGSGVDDIRPATPGATASIRSSSTGRCSCWRRTIRSWRSIRRRAQEKWSHRNEGAVERSRHQLLGERRSDRIAGCCT